MNSPPCPPEGGGNPNWILLNSQWVYSPLSDGLGVAYMKKQKDKPDCKTKLLNYFYFPVK